MAQVGTHQAAARAEQRAKRVKARKPAIAERQARVGTLELAPQRVKALAAAAQGYPTQVFVTLRHDLNKSLNLFLKYYAEEYDFVLAFTDHAIPSSGVQGVFQPVTRKAVPGLASPVRPGSIASMGRRPRRSTCASRIATQTTQPQPRLVKRCARTATSS